jgi:hypothetical protein
MQQEMARRGGKTPVAAAPSGPLVFAVTLATCRYGSMPLQPTLPLFPSLPSLSLFFFLSFKGRKEAVSYSCLSERVKHM